MSSGSGICWRSPKGLGAFKGNAVTLLTQTSATLNARVNPGGQNVTECEFAHQIIDVFIKKL
jgi:hypothetical protein